MSHFGVIVIGNDVEAQLQPYHEFECTGMDDKYVKDIDITADVIERINKTSDERGLVASSRMLSSERIIESLEYFGLNEKVIDDERDANRIGEHKFGFAVVRNGTLIKAVRRTNPDKKWDWWVFGGRWSDWLLLKSGKTANTARKCDIDFNGMRDMAGSSAVAMWDKVNNLLIELGLQPTWTKWDNMRDVVHAGNINQARSAYNDQPQVKAISKIPEFRFGYDLDSFLVSREDYVEDARRSATSLYALVAEGKWFAIGDMGWFGMSDDKMSYNEWGLHVDGIIDALPDETAITVVDCHI